MKYWAYLVFLTIFPVHLWVFSPFNPEECYSVRATTLLVQGLLAAFVWPTVNHDRVAVFWLFVTLDKVRKFNMETTIMSQIYLTIQLYMNANIFYPLHPISNSISISIVFVFVYLFKFYYETIITIQDFDLFLFMTCV